MNLTIDWQALKTLTEYCREDIKGFCEDEGFPVYPSRLHPFQALFLRNLLLCNWSVREGHFAYYWQAQQAFDLFWGELPDDVGDCQLAESWIAWCEGSLRQKNSFGKEKLSKTVLLMVVKKLSVLTTMRMPQLRRRMTKQYGKGRRGV